MLPALSIRISSLRDLLLEERVSENLVEHVFQIAKKELSHRLEWMEG